MLWIGRSESSRTSNKYILVLLRHDSESIVASLRHALGLTKSWPTPCKGFLRVHTLTAQCRLLAHCFPRTWSFTSVRLTCYNACSSQSNFAKVLRLHSTLDGCHFGLVAMLITLDVRSVDLLLHSLNSLISERFVFEHCRKISKRPRILPSWYDLQNVSSSRVRLYVSGYMK